MTVDIKGQHKNARTHTCHTISVFEIKVCVVVVVTDQCVDMEIATAAITSIRLDDEVIPTKGEVVMASHEQPEVADRISVCSCSCYNLRSGKFRRKSRLFKSLRFSKKDRNFASPSQGVGGGGARLAKQQYETEERVTDAEENIAVVWKELCSLKRASI